MFPVSFVLLFNLFTALLLFNLVMTLVCFRVLLVALHRLYRGSGVQRVPAFGTRPSDGWYRRMLVGASSQSQQPEPPAYAARGHGAAAS